MALTGKQQRIVDIVQWILIIILAAVCAVNIIEGCSRNKSKVEESRKEETYVRIYESQEIESLKKENRALYDSISQLKNVESAVEVRYVTKMVRDTIPVTQFVREEIDSVASVYHYAEDNDTVKLNIDVCARDLAWVKGNVEIHDSFRIINTNDGDTNTMTVQHPSNVEIEDVTAWRRKDNKKWTDGFHFGPQVGVGYGFINGKADIYVGFGCSYQF